MPIYEYRCESCGHELEALQKMSDPLLTECPECRQDSLKKALTAAGFRLKGGGWYETDFKGGAKRQAKEQDDSGKGEKPSACAAGCGCHN
jgi:putative FmdB family regulatory protein